MAPAHYQVRRALLSGSITRLTCEQPGCTRIGEAHHEDYDKPLAVIWLCRLHHYWLHRDRRAGCADPAWLVERIAQVLDVDVSDLLGHAT